MLELLAKLFLALIDEQTACRLRQVVANHLRRHHKAIKNRLDRFYQPICRIVILGTVLTIGSYFFPVVGLITMGIAWVMLGVSVVWTVRVMCGDPIWGDET